MPIMPIRERNPLNLLIEVRQQFTQRALALKLSVTARTISRWENRQTQIPLIRGAGFARDSPLRTRKIRRVCSVHFH